RLASTLLRQSVQFGLKIGVLSAVLLGFIEGLTEYLPISSTGHLILADHFLGLAQESSKSFDIVIQLGAILAVLVHYRGLLAERLRWLLSRDPKATALFTSLGIAFMPAAVVGFLFRKKIKEHLFGPVPVAVALIVGGVVMIVVEWSRRRRGTTGEE